MLGLNEFDSLKTAGAVLLPQMHLEKAWPPFEYTYFLNIYIYIYKTGLLENIQGVELQNATTQTVNCDTNINMMPCHLQTWTKLWCAVLTCRHDILLTGPKFGWRVALVTSVTQLTLIQSCSCSSVTLRTCTWCLLSSVLRPVVWCVQWWWTMTGILTTSDLNPSHREQWAKED